MGINSFMIDLWLLVILFEMIFVLMRISDLLKWLYTVAPISQAPHPPGPQPTTSDIKGIVHQFWIYNTFLLNRRNNIRRTMPNPIGPERRL